MFARTASRKYQQSCLLYEKCCRTIYAPCLTEEPETKALVILLVLIHNTFNALAFPFADSLGKGLRATGDVRFPTAISIFTTVGIRLVFSWLFGIVFSWGVLGIAWAMCLDWTIRGIIFYLRFRSKKWTNFQVI